MATGARQRLLDAAIEYIAQHGISDVSLRGLAAAIGTSHRMLIHHFGGREGLWTAVIQEVEARQRAALAALSFSPDPAEAQRQWWRHISDPALAPNERLFFELYGQALQGRPGTEALLDGIVDAWVQPAAALLVERGMELARAQATVRLGIAVTRGLLLDLLATGNREAVDAAMELYIERIMR